MVVKILRKVLILSTFSILAIFIGAKTPAISAEIEEWIFKNSDIYGNYQTLRDTSLRLNDEVFVVEVADTIEEKIIGLMNRQNLAQNEGMIFIYKEPGINIFWMKDTYISLDIIWLNEDREIIHIAENTVPLDTFRRYGPREESMYVIEVLAGSAKRVGLKIGDKVSFSPNLLSCCPLIKERV